MIFLLIFNKKVTKPFEVILTHPCKEIVIKEVISPSELKTFVYLSEKLHEKRPNWVPPIYADEWIFFDHKKSCLRSS
jgi:hypothetical protein